MKTSFRVDANFSRKFPQKRAVITGAASGYGLAVTKLLANDGWSLCLIDSDEQALERCKTQLSSIGRTQTIALDVTEYNKVGEVIDEFCQRNSGIDFLVNSAGIGAGGLFMELNHQQWDRLMQVNVTATANCIQAVLPYMQSQNTGQILNVASAAAFHCLPGLAAYAATKSAVVSLSESLYAELRHTGIDVSVKCTAFYRGSNIANYTLGAASEINKTKLLVDMAPIHVDQVAVISLQKLTSGPLYLVFPLQAKIIWWLKRFFPMIWSRLSVIVARKIEEKNAQGVT